MCHVTQHLTCRNRVKIIYIYCGLLLNFLQMSTSFCNIWPPSYGVNTQHYNHSFTHLTYVLLLHYRTQNDSHKTVQYSIAGFNVPLDTLQVILETIFPASHLTGAQNEVFLTNHLAGTSKTHVTTTNETKAWFRSPFMPSGQEMNRTYSTTHAAHKKTATFD